MENPMNAALRPPPAPDHEYAVAAGIMAMAASIAQEICEKWPFAAARLRVELSGAMGCPERRLAVGRALTLGLSGIVDSASDTRKAAFAFALQERMMAVRLSGRKLVAFHPDRDLRFRPERSELPIGALRANVWSADAKLIGSTARFMRSA
jgi:hypothetical protein